MPSVLPHRTVECLSLEGRVAVVAPASAPQDRADLDRGLERLQRAGLTVVTAYDMTESPGYLADADDVRVKHLNSMLRRDDIGAIFCARGGYGSLRILEQIDYDAVSRAPKIIVGYSDITAIHLAVLARTGVPGLSAAMVATDWADIDDAEAKSILSCLAGSANTGVFSPGGLELTPEKTGSAEGRAVGGNLTVICRLVGTPYLPDLDGSILFVEEVGEPPYRIDGLFAQLKLSGILGRLGGLVIGGITDSEPPDGRPSLTLRDLVDHYRPFVNGPVVSGLPYGHFQPKVPMPVGTRVRVEADDRYARIVALEQVVAVA